MIARGRGSAGIRVPSLERARAVVAGASRGIGEAIAWRLVEAGATVVGLARSAEGLDAAGGRMPAGGRFIAMPCDVSTDAGLRGIANAGWLREIDVLVLSAGIMHEGPAASATPGEFDELFATNLRAPYALIQLAMQGLIASGGQIVLISSSAALGGRSGAVQYAALQAALHSLSKSIRDELNPLGVRVLTVFPGRVAGARQQAIHRRAGVPYREEVLMQPDDVAQMVLASLRLPYSAEVTELHLRPMRKG
jgi:NADP-dependent 3-hydroxy acid dehydrogenase YdfG